MSPLKPHVLKTLRLTPNIPPGSWYYLTCTTLALLNHPSAVPTVFSHALAHPENESPEKILNKTREALLKASAIGGLPKIINALHELKKHTTTTEEGTADMAQLLQCRAPTTRRTMSHEAALARGDSFFSDIYGRASGRVMSGMRASYDDLGEVARVLYAHVLSEEGVLGARETGYVLVAGLVVGGEEVGPQLKGHVRGVRNNGASVEAVRAVAGLGGRVWEVVTGERWRGEVPGLEERGKRRGIVHE